MAKQPKQQEQEERPDNFKKCEKIFVPWSWTVIFVTGFIIISVVAAIGYSERETKQDEALKKGNYELIINKLDTINTKLDDLRNDQ
jgi:hypothetical protein